MKLEGFIKKYGTSAAGSKGAKAPKQQLLSPEKSKSSTALAVRPTNFPSLQAFCTNLLDKPEFLKGASDEIGEPKKRETEDEFVVRASKVLQRRFVEALKSNS